MFYRRKAIWFLFNLVELLIFVAMLEIEKHNFEKTVIVGIVTQNQNEDKLIEYLDELEFLTYTAGGEVVKRFTQKWTNPTLKRLLELES